MPYIETKDGDPIRLLNLETGMVDPSALKLHETNPRQGDVGAIATSYRENGFYGRVIVDKRDSRVLAGNHRVKAALALGMEKIPVEYIETDGDIHAIKVLVGDNRHSDLATYDNDILVELLQTVADSPEGLLGTGYDGDDVDDLLQALRQPNDGEWGAAFGMLPDGDKEPFQQMTFTLHDTQAERVREALQAAKDRAGGFDGSPNENSNGNALALICESFMYAAC